MGADDASISDGDILGEDVEGIDMSDEEDSVEKDSAEGDSDDDSMTGSFASGVEGDASDEADSELGSSDDEEMSDEEEEAELAAAAAEEAYMRQLQDEEFESELRRLTMEALTARTGARGKVSSQMPAAPQYIQKGDSAASAFGSGEGMAFKLFKRGNKGKQEEVNLVIPQSTNLARRANKQDDEAAKERDLLKARVLQYEAESADAIGGNVYLDDTKLQVIRNRPLTMETINKNFGTSEKPRGRGLGRGPGRAPGRGRGGGRLFNPGRAS